MQLVDIIEAHSLIIYIVTVQQVHNHSVDVLISMVIQDNTQQNQIHIFMFIISSVVLIVMSMLTQQFMYYHLTMTRQIQIHSLQHL